ncbi:agmatine deiminase family protein [Companilactobacillus sp. DQM5]|uniref:agmatine deiminase family protein n=1 Tax=Companilactobacillus sp. DQM5 TaxID=3463359 RepID=UPI004058A251
MKKILMGGVIIISLITLFKESSNSKETLFTGYSNNKYYKPFKNNIKELRNHLKSNSVKYDDIWIKDVAPIVTDRLVKFQYHPRYLKNSLSSYLDTNFRKWLDNNKFKYTSSDIILDGGNFVFDGVGTAIITKRILKDNPEYSKNELLKTLKTQLHIKNIILISPEPGDVLAHADGQVFFVNSHTLFIGDFEGKNHVKKN